MTKIIAVSLFATVLLTSHPDANDPLTGAALGTATPNIASKYPDLHRTLTDGTYDSMPFEQQIMFLHEPFFRDLAEFGLDTVAIDAEREFIADMASKLADAAKASASVFQIDDVFEQKVLEMHTAVFVAHDRTTALADPAVSAPEFIRKRRQVMDLQQRMLDLHRQTMEMAQEASAPSTLDLRVSGRRSVPRKARMRSRTGVRRATATARRRRRVRGALRRPPEGRARADTKIKG